MNFQPIFDINIYNRYLYYSGGQHPNFYQYQQFVNNLYYHNYYQNSLAQSPPLPSEPVPALPSEPVPSPALPSEPVPNSSGQTTKNNCIRGMGCKNIKCSDFHHPSKDLDIINQIRNN
jgi:hypothetical protein